MQMLVQGYLNFRLKSGTAGCFATFLKKLLPGYAMVMHRPLWLRMEWNIINFQELLEFADAQREQRGLRVEVPEVSASTLT
jgi:hypothetical protein